MKKTNKLLYYSVLSGIFLIPFIPFIVSSDMFFPFITGKGFAFRILTEIIFGLYILLAIIDNDYRPKDSWITRSVVVFTVITFIADLFGVNSSKSLWSNYERMEGFVLIFHLFLFYVVTSSFFQTAKDWKRYFDVTILASVLMSIFAVFQLLGKAVINQGGDRVDATFGNATYFAIYLVFHIFLSLYFIANSNTKKLQKYYYFGVVLLETVILFYTATRGAVLGLIGGLIVSSLYIVFKENKNIFFKKMAYSILAACFLVVVGFSFVKNNDFVRNNKVLYRFSTISFSEIKTQGRYFVWPMAFEGFKEKPILGWGQEGFNYVFNKNYNPQMFGQEEWFDRTHNVFLDWLIAGGLLGLLAYLSLYVSLLFYVYRSHEEINQTDRAIMFGMVAAYMFHNIFVFDNLVSYIMFFSILAFVHSVYAKKLGTFDRYQKIVYSSDTINYVALPLVVLITLSGIYLINYPAYSANKTLIKAMSPQGDVKVNLTYFKKAYSYNSFGFDEITEQFVTAASSVNSQNVPADIKQQFVEMAKQKIEEKLSKTPHDTRYLVFAGSFYNQIHQPDQALKYLSRALEESPNKVSILFEIGSSYLAKGDLQKMFEYFKKAYDLKPEHPESVKILALGAIYTRNYVELTKLESKIDKNSIVNDDRFLRAYMDIGDYNKVISMLNIRIQNDPKNIQNKLTLASVYTTIGQKQKSVEILREILVDHPEYKDDIENYIKQLSS